VAAHRLLTAVLLVPVMLFYFLRDWHEFVRRVEGSDPAPFATGGSEFCREIKPRWLESSFRGADRRDSDNVRLLCVGALDSRSGVLAADRHTVGLAGIRPLISGLVGLLLATSPGMSQFEQRSGLVGAEGCLPA